MSAVDKQNGEKIMVWMSSGRQDGEGHDVVARIDLPDGDTDYLTRHDCEQLARELLKVAGFEIWHFRTHAGARDEEPNENDAGIWVSPFSEEDRKTFRAEAEKVFGPLVGDVADDSDKDEF